MEPDAGWHVLIMAIKETEHTLISLSARQKACLKKSAEGKTARAIARELDISVRMVRWHLQQARERLNAASTAQAVYLADRLGWLD